VRRFGLLPALAVFAAASPVGAGARDACDPARSGQAVAADASPAARALERGNELAARGDASAARLAYGESRSLALASGDGPLATLAAANAARAALDAGDLEGAERELPAALDEAEYFPDARVRSRLLVHIGRTWALLALRRPGGDAARRAAETLDRAAIESRAAGETRNEAYALGWLGELYESGGRPDAALELTLRALDAGLRADAPDAIYRWQWQAGRIHRASGRPDEALAAYRGAATTLARLREQTAASGSDFTAALGGAGDLYQELVDLLLARVAAIPDAAQRQALLRETLAALESQKVDELRDYYRDECLAAQRRAAPDTLPGAIVVYPVPLADRLELIVGGEGSLERFASPVDLETFTAEVHAFRHTLTRRTTREYLRHAQRLYDWVIRPLEPTLERRHPRALVFVPGGALRTIPFAALFDREKEAFLIEKVPVAILPGLTLTDPRPLPREDIRVLVAGISEAVDGFPPVARVADEVEVVHEAFPGRVLLNEQFAVSRFVEEVEERPFGIVHVASHAEFSGDPEGSFLLAFDGKISLERLASVVGSTRFRAEHPLELLALSACETAAGSDRAALGLAGIALRAGARSALATLWSVNDDAAAKLVTAFYRELGNPELSRAEALQQAQLELLRTREWRHPALWAAFVLISSWL